MVTVQFSKCVINICYYAKYFTKNVALGSYCYNSVMLFLTKYQTRVKKTNIKLHKKSCSTYLKYVYTCTLKYIFFIIF